MRGVRERVLLGVGAIAVGSVLSLVPGPASGAPAGALTSSPIGGSAKPRLTACDDVLVGALCGTLTTPPAAYQPAPPRPPGGRYAKVPTLVLSGELDTITTAAEGRLVARQFPRSTRVLMAAGLHVTAWGADGQGGGCVGAIVRTFVARGSVGQTACARRLPPLRTAPPFWTSLDDAVAATPDGTPDGTPDAPAGRTARKVASVAVATAGDAVARWWQTYETGGRGLRGGTWSVDDDLTFTLTGYALVPGVPVSGTVTWDRAAGTIAARLRTGGSAKGTLTASWDTVLPGARAQVRGTVERRAVRAHLLAP